MKEWARRNPPSVIALAITLLAVAVLGVEWWLMGGKTILALDAFDSIGEPDKKVEAYGKLLPAIGLLAAAPVGVAGVALAFWRSWNQHRDGMTAIRKLDAEAYAKAAEAFAKAVELLGHKESSIRMGAVLALEALGKATPRLLSQTIEILCAYVREKQPVSPITLSGETTKNASAPPLPTDIQLILNIVNRLKREDKDNRIKIDLSRVDLRNASLSEGDLRGANLCKADLRGAELRKADLSEANLRKADLSKANLLGVNLSKAYLVEANLGGADLRGTDLRKANLVGANLRDAKLTNTIFENTILPDGADWTGIGPPPGFDPTPVTNA